MEVGDFATRISKHGARVLHLAIGERQPDRHRLAPSLRGLRPRRRPLSTNSNAHAPTSPTRPKSVGSPTLAASGSCLFFGGWTAPLRSRHCKTRGTESLRARHLKAQHPLHGGNPPLARYRRGGHPTHRSTRPSHLRPDRDEAGTRRLKPPRVSTSRRRRACSASRRLRSCAALSKAGSRLASSARCHANSAVSSRSTT